MPRLQAAVTAFWAAMLASEQASSRSPTPGFRGEQPPAAKASYHFWQSAQKMSTRGAWAMKGWWSQVSARVSFMAWSVISRMV